MVITVTLNPALDKSVVIDNFAPNKVNRIKEIRLDAGGKGINVSKVIHALGGESLAIGILGGTIGGYIESTLEDLDIDHDFVYVPEETRTNLKIFDPVTHVYTDINEPGSELPAERLRELETKLFFHAKSGDAVVFAGAALIGIPEDIIERWSARLTSAGVRIFDDLDGELMNHAINSKPYLIKPNLAEFKRLCNLGDTSLPSLVRAARKLVKSGVQNVVVSRSAAGAVFVNASEALVGKAPKFEAVSTVGAGDSMTAALVCASQSGMSWRDAFALAMATATAKVTVEGNTPPTLEAVKAFLPQIEITEYRG